VEFADGKTSSEGADCTHGVDPVEVGIVGQHQTFVGRGVEVAVDRLPQLSSV
jgi:hypothetical protein